MKKTPKNYKVIAHLLAVGNISTWEAITTYQLTHLPHVIHELRTQGALITTREEKHLGGTHARYILENKESLINALSNVTKKGIEVLLKASNLPGY